MVADPQAMDTAQAGSWLAMDTVWAADPFEADMSVAVDQQAAGRVWEVDQQAAGRVWEVDQQAVDKAWVADPLAIGKARAADQQAAEAVVVAGPLAIGIVVMIQAAAADSSNSSSFHTLFLTFTSNAEYLADLIVEIQLTAFQVDKHRLIVLGNVRTLRLLAQPGISYHCTCHHIRAALIQTYRCIQQFVNPFHRHYPFISGMFIAQHCQCLKITGFCRLSFLRILVNFLNGYT
jgi:hypothetical protein